MMKFTKYVSITFFARILSLTIGLISGIVIARVFGPEGKGIFAYLAFFIGITTLLGNLGLVNANTYFLRKDIKLLPNIVSNSLVISIGAGIIFSTAALLAILFVPDAILGEIDAKFAAIFIPVIPLALLTIFFQNIFLATGYVYRYAFIPLMVTASQVTAIIVLTLLFHWELYHIMIAWAAIYAIGALYFLFYFILQRNFKLSFSRLVLRRMLGYGLRGYAAALLAFLIVKADVYMVNNMLNTQELGLYSIASNIADYIFILPSIAGTIFFAESVALRDARQFIASVMRIIFLIILFGSAAVFFATEPLINLLFGAEFLPAVYAVRLLLPGIVFFSLSILLMNYFAGRGMPYIVIISPLFALILNITLNIVLIPDKGIEGAAIASSIAYFVMFCVNIIYFIFKENMGLLQIFHYGRSDITSFIKVIRGDA